MFLKDNKQEHKHINGRTKHRPLPDVTARNRTWAWWVEPKTENLIQWHNDNFRGNYIHELQVVFLSNTVTSLMFADKPMFMGLIFAVSSARVFQVLSVI